MLLEHQTGAYNRGYRLAYQLWQTWNYGCTRDEVDNVFKPDVEDEVYDECEESYKYKQERKRACKKGADDFVFHKSSECSTGTECKEYGDIAAEEIASTLSPVDYSFSIDIGDIGEFDPECEENAKIRCYDEVVLLVESWCKDQKDLSLNYLKEKCNENIEDLIE